MKLNILAIKNFISACETDQNGVYASSPNGEATLYGTCYALMTMFYLGDSIQSRLDSLDFILSCQDPVTGYFIGPELKEWSPESDSKHDQDHLLTHLACHVLPVLDLFNMQPRSSLNFAHKFLDKQYLFDYLNSRDLKDAWLEGNNLLFVGQLIIYLRDRMKMRDADKALALYFTWLDDKVDPLTGLWGTDGFCSPFIAMCGGYHQLLVYYFEKREVRFKKQLIDTVLSLQHRDGGFHPQGGGGACEDVDAADILVNMYKQIDYKRLEIRIALRRLLHSVLEKQMPDGGFVYRLGEPFIHMGVPKTYSSANCSNLFPTWFRIHTLALIREILTDERLLKHNWKFNPTCSMGWHKPWEKANHRITFIDKIKELLYCLRMNSTNKQRLKYLLKKHLPYNVVKILENVNKG